MNKYCIYLKEIKLSAIIMKKNICLKLNKPGNI